jgi:hypothetical protein
MTVSLPSHVCAAGYETDKLVVSALTLQQSH